MTHFYSPGSGNFLSGHRFVWLLLCLPLLLLCFSLRLLTGQSSAAPAVPNDPLAPGSIAGQVRSDSDIGLAGIEVKLYRLYYYNQTPYVIRTTTTENNGDYRFAVVAPGVYAVEFVDPAGDYAFQLYGGAVTIGSATPLYIAGNDLSGINVRLHPGGAITGILTATSDLHFYGGDVTLYRKATETMWQEMLPIIVQSPTNTFNFRGLASGVYRLCATGWGYDHGSYVECFDNVSPYTKGVAGATDIQVTQGLTTSGILITVGNHVLDPELSGQVRNQAGEPLAGITVKVSSTVNEQAPPIYTAGSYANGHYRVRAGIPGTYLVEFTDPEGVYAPAIYQRLGDTGPTPVTLPPFTLQQGIDITLTTAAHITGKVLIAGQTPPAGGSVNLLPGDNVEYLANVQIDPLTGEYDIGGLTAGSYRVLAGAILDSNSFTGFYGGPTLDTATVITITAGEIRRNIDITLGANDFAGEIRGTVLADNRPATQIRVDLFWSASNPSSMPPLYHTFTDSAGRYQIAGLLAGYHLVRFSDPAGIYATTYYTHAQSSEDAQRLEVKGATLFPHVDATLVHSGAIQGRVTRTNGSPFAQVWIVAYTNVNGVWRGLGNEAVDSDLDGRYRLSGLRPGVYLVKFVDRNSPLQEFYGGKETVETATLITVTADQTTSNIDLILGPDRPLYLPVIQR